jgi:hypothetical protein
MGDVLKYEVNPNYTREVITLLQGMPYPVGSVLGQITASGKYALSPDTGADGSETAAAVLLYAVDATAADAVGIVLVRGPAIVSRAALAYDAAIDLCDRLNIPLPTLPTPTPRNREEEPVALQPNSCTIPPEGN